MLKKTIKFEDYNGEMGQKDCYFNLSKAELMKMELTTEGGMEKTLKEVSESKDVARMLTIIENIVRTAYGVKTVIKDENGKDAEIFKKTPDLTEAFMNSPLYDALFIELTTNAQEAVAFVKGLMPASVQKELEKEENKHLLAPNTVE